MNKTKGTVMGTKPIVVLGLDDSPSADRVIARAAQLARGPGGAELHVVHAVDMLEAGGSVPVVVDVLDRHRAILERRALQAQTESGSSVFAHFHASDPARAILQTASSVDADLILVGCNDGHKLRRWLLGSVAETVVRRAACEVLVVRDKDHAKGHAPEVEPPCPECLAVQRASSGATMWCAHHATVHPHAHTYYAGVDRFGVGSNLLRPSEEA
jgi:nucleotide-binding universal stress UspA family protein